MELPDEAIDYQIQGLIAPAATDAFTPLAELQGQHFLTLARLRGLLPLINQVRSQVAVERDLANPTAEMKPLDAGFIDLPQKMLDQHRRKPAVPSIRRLGAWLASKARDPKAGLRLVIGFAIVHAALWTLILVNLKTGQDIHMDVAEAFAWGQKFLLGYGKHPPLSGWVAGAWFMVFPVTDWATYALAMATLGCGLVICWLLALRVVDRRRAFLVVVMLALYPIFNFKGFKYNPDILQLVTLPLLMLAYLDAFEKRSVKSGFWLGLAGALALMTKYWVLTMIGAIGLAALLHPARLQFLRSPAPWVAITTLVAAMVPASAVAEAGEFRRAHLCRRYL